MEVLFTVKCKVEKTLENREPIRNCFEQFIRIVVTVLRLGGNMLNMLNVNFELKFK